MAVSIKKEREIKLSSGENLSAHCEYYEDANSVVEDCKTRKVRHEDYDISGNSYDSSFEGVKSYDEALSLLKDGYQSVVDNFRNELKVSDRYSPRFAFSNNVYGFTPVVPLAIKGIPTCMRNMEMRPIKAKVLDIYYDIGVVASYTSDQIIKAGQTVLGTILELERMGYRFNLFATQTYFRESDSHNNSILDILCVKVKSSNTPLDLKRLSFPLVHPAFFRVIGFDWQGKSPITRYIGGGRGTDFPTHVSDDDVRKTVKEMFSNTACYISARKVIDNNYNRDYIKGVFTDVTPKK